jgi:hypothetical protein
LIAINGNGSKCAACRRDFVTSSIIRDFLRKDKLGGAWILQVMTDGIVKGD